MHWCLIHAHLGLTVRAPTPPLFMLPPLLRSLLLLLLFLLLPVSGTLVPRPRSLC